MLLIVKNGVCGGVSTITCTESIANKKHIPKSYDTSKEEKYIAYLDANN